VISQTERDSSRLAGADRAVALKELRSWTEASVARLPGVEVVSTVDAAGDDRAMRLRCRGSDRAITLDLDPVANVVTVYRDTALHRSIDPFEGGSPDGPRRSIQAELDWLCGG
jgi:hypothetical protein